MQQSELVRRMASGAPPVVVDVRTGFEFRAGHIPGALHVPTWKILLRIDSIPADRGSELVVLCALGPRAAIAKGLLGLLGYRDVTLLEGHMSLWQRSGLPLQKN
jgi:rhodanese-related sulfurtransferase